MTGDAAGWDLRPLAVDDIEAALAVIEAADAGLAEEGLHPTRTAPSDADGGGRRLAHARFVQRDGPGAWVAVSDGQLVGVAESIRRGNFWGLSMLFVHPDFQSRGVGGQLLKAALSYAAGASQRMIVSSADPRAMRRYFLAGLAMHPAAELVGPADRRAIPASLPGRDGTEEHLELVASVEAQLGRSRSEDAAFMLEDGRFRLDVIDSGPGRGWALWRPDRLAMLGATDEQTAASLLWRYLSHCEGEPEIYGLTAAQQWAFAVAHEARLTVRTRGALFVDGMAVPGPWVPSGWYF
ncbi:MAG: GNAT family N-acetyltransferase [Acidimicrobiales bacterium]